MKRIAGVLLGLLIATNLYAQTGDLKVNKDLIVDGKLGVGLPSGTSPVVKLDVVGTTQGNADNYVYLGGIATGRTIRIGADSVGYATIQGLVRSSGAIRDISLQNDGGNVGIGTPAPGYKLTINGNVNSWLSVNSNAFNGAEFDFAHGGGYGAFINAGSNASASTYALAVYGNSNPFFYVRGDGNVGIGTASPGAKLDVFRTGSIYQYDRVMIDPASNFPKVYFGDGSTYNPYIGYEYIGNERMVLNSRYSGSHYELQIAGAEKVRIDSNGNVGIGTPTPGYKLDVAGTIRSTAGGFVFPDGTTQTTAFSGTASQASYLNTAGLYYQGGNVGIGTTGPDSKLSVGGTGILNAGIYGTGSAYGVYGQSGGAGTYGVYGKISTAGSTSAGVFGSNEGTANGFGVRGEGFYGLYGYSGVSNGYGIYCNSANAYGCGGNKAWYSSSDEKFKENISTIDSALSRIRLLRGVGFNWKGDTEKKHQHGFIAQEAMKVVPEVVGKDPDGNYTMSYSSLVPLLVEAIKEQQMQIEALNARLDALTKK